MIPKALIFVCSIFVFCESAFVDHLEKCGINDNECQKRQLQGVIRDIGKSGIPEYGIPPIDPFEVKDASVSILNMVNITMVDGVVKGVKDCVVDKMETFMEEERATMELTCDVLIKGKYKLYGSSPLIKSVLGGSTVHGEGNSKVKIDKMHMKFEYNLYVRERNGDIYIDCQFDDLKYSYTLGKVTFAADNIYIGDTESSNLIINILNDNWKFIMQNFGKPFLDKAMDITYATTHKFFDVVPAKYYISDDLTPYIKKD